MGRIFKEHLEGSRVYSCDHCKTHLALASQLVSKQFHSRSGKAYLFNSVSNVCAGPREERLMTTGMHVVRDCYCNTCLSLVGWRYEDASDATQKYKINKFILERSKVVDASRVARLMLFTGGESDSDCP